jgi:hypothetical protein
MWYPEYHDAAGELIKGTLSKESPPQNPVLTVLYDPDKLRQFISYPVARHAIAIPKRS